MSNNRDVKGIVIFLLVTLAALIVGGGIIYLSESQNGQITVETVKLMIKGAVPCAIGAGWTCYSVYKHKVKPTGGIEIKTKITIEGTAIILGLFLLLNLLL